MKAKTTYDSMIEESLSKYHPGGTQSLKDTFLLVASTDITIYGSLHLV